MDNKILIIESCEKRLDRTFKNSTIVHVRNSVIIQDILKCDLVSHISDIPNVINESYDTIICMYGSPYMKYDQYMSIMDKNHTAKMYWLVNDHDLEDNILLRKWLIKYSQPYHMICNNSRLGYRHWILGKNMHGKKLNDWIDEWDVVNLNVLIFENNINHIDLFTPEKSDCVYFGTFRKHRVKDILNYNSANYVISTSKKNILKYQNAGITARFIDKLSWEKGKETLHQFKYSIYFEDELTHTNYAYMANRYYECVMMDVLMFFDYRCDLTIRSSGYLIDDYLICQNGDELRFKMDELDKSPMLYYNLLQKQRSNIPQILKEKQEVIEFFKNKFKN